MLRQDILEKYVNTLSAKYIAPTEEMINFWREVSTTIAELYALHDRTKEKAEFWKFIEINQLTEGHSFEDYLKDLIYILGYEPEYKDFVEAHNEKM